MLQESHIEQKSGKDCDRYVSVILSLLNHRLPKSSSIELIVLVVSYVSVQSNKESFISYGKSISILAKMPLLMLQ